MLKVVDIYILLCNEYIFLFRLIICFLFIYPHFRHYWHRVALHLYCVVRGYLSSTLVSVMSAPCQPSVQQVRLAPLHSSHRPTLLPEIPSILSDLRQGGYWCYSSNLLIQNWHNLEQRLLFQAHNGQKPEVVIELRAGANAQVSRP